VGDVTGLLLVGVAALAGAALLAVLAVVPAGPGRVPRSRLDPTVVEPGSALAGASAALGTAVEKALVRRGLAASGAIALERAGMSLRLADLVLLTGGIAVAAGVLGWLAGGLLLALAALVVVPLGAKVLVSLRASRRQAAFADQLDDSLQLMASSMRAGHSLLRALDAVAQDADSPTSDEFARIVNETRVGRDLTAALEETAERMGSDDFAWVAQAIAIHREVGGNLAEVLDAVSATIRERGAIRRQVKALAAEGKLSAIVLLVLPFGISGFLYMTNPAYLARFTHSGLGWAMLVAAGVLLSVGALWLKKTVSIRF
jgi:tight adherence protein B